MRLSVRYFRDDATHSSSTIKSTRRSKVQRASGHSLRPTHSLLNLQRRTASTSSSWEQESRSACSDACTKLMPLEYSSNCEGWKTGARYEVSIPTVCCLRRLTLKRHSTGCGLQESAVRRLDRDTSL